VSKRTGIILGVVTGVAVIVAILAVALSGGSDNNSVSTADQSTTTQATLSVTTTQGGNSGGGNSSGGSTPAQPQSTNKPPYIRDLTGDTDTTDDQGNHVPVGLIDGHAIDPDGTDQEVETITVNWGDGNTTTAGKGGNNAFSAQHPYDLSFSGQTVTVKVTVIDAKGATASQNVTLNLPTI
jgi:hypothetical protein